MFLGSRDFPKSRRRHHAIGSSLPLSGELARIPGIGSNARGRPGICSRHVRRRLIVRLIRISSLIPRHRIADGAKASSGRDGPSDPTSPLQRGSSLQARVALRAGVVRRWLAQARRLQPRSDADQRIATATGVALYRAASCGLRWEGIDAQACRLHRRLLACDAGELQRRQ